jgi:hypothetical protein
LLVWGKIENHFTLYDDEFFIGCCASMKWVIVLIAHLSDSIMLSLWDYCVWETGFFRFLSMVRQTLMEESEKITTKITIGQVFQKIFHFS